MARIRVKDVRAAIEGMPDDADVSLDMADPPTGYDFRIDGVGNYGGTLQISVSDGEYDDDENEVEVTGGVMQWDEDDGTIRFTDDHGNTSGLWRPGDPEYAQYKQQHFPAHTVLPDEEDEDEDEDKEKQYEVTFKTVVTATDEEDAANEARDTIGHDDYEPTEVKRLED